MTQNTNINATKQEFPHFVAHRDAVCFRCGCHLSDLSPTRNAPGCGHYRGDCEGCGLRTWYDCAEGSVEMITVNERRERAAAEKRLDATFHVEPGKP